LFEVDGFFAQNDLFVTNAHVFLIDAYFYRCFTLSNFIFWLLLFSPLQATFLAFILFAHLWSQIWKRIFQERMVGITRLKGFITTHNYTVPFMVKLSQVT